MTPQEMKLSNLLTDFAYLMERELARDARDAQIAADLVEIRRELGSSLFYSHAEVCRRLGGYGPKWGYQHPEMLPPPLVRCGEKKAKKPFRYLKTAVDQKAMEMILHPVEPSKHSRRGRAKIREVA